MPPSSLADVQLHLVETIDDAMALKRWLGERHDGPLAIDTESGGLHPWEHRLRLIQIGDKHTGWAIDWERWGGAALEVMNAWDGEWVTHNGVFDYRFLAHHTGFHLPWHKLHDTLTLGRLDDPTRANGLKNLAAALIDPRATIGERILKDGMTVNKWTWDTVPTDYPPYWIYSALDPVLTARLHEHLAPRVTAACPAAYDLERAANRLCTRMMMKGMQLDVPYVEKAIDDFAARATEIRAWLKRTHDISSPKSGGQLRRAFERLGQDILFWTDNGAPQFDKDALAFYHTHGTNPAVQQLAQYIRGVRHIEDITGRYLESFLELKDSDDVVHCTVNVMGARTGRMSVSDPALQQLPRDDVAIRGSFIPRPGHVFISCDLDQVEMRILAHLTEDPGLIAAFHEADNGGADFFTTIARLLYHDPHMVKADKRRQPLKNSMYARAYGSGRENLAATAGVTVEEIIVLENMTDTRFPGMKRLMDRLEREASLAFRSGQRGGVRLASGRFLPCDRGREYTTLNYLIQGTAAEYMKMCLLNLDAAGLTDHLVLPIHDEALLEVPIDQADDILHTVQECMTDRTGFRVPLTAGGAILTERWAKAA